MDFRYLTVPKDEQMSGDTPKYELFVNNEAEQNLEASYFYVSSLTTSERALEWVADLRSALEKLTRFPGPKACAIDEAATKRRGREVRRLLYRGPNRRPLQTAYHVFYLINDPTDNDDGLVSIIRIRHAMREGTLYPALRILEQDEMIESRWETPERGPARKIYTLTHKGRMEQARRAQEWRQYASVIGAIVGGKRPDENPI